MQKLAEVCIRRPVFAAMIVLSLVVVGAASYARLGVDRFPAVDIPSVSVRTELAEAFRGSSVEIHHFGPLKQPASPELHAHGALSLAAAASLSASLTAPMPPRGNPHDASWPSPTSPIL